MSHPLTDQQSIEAKEYADGQGSAWRVLVAKGHSIDDFKAPPYGTWSLSTVHQLWPVSGTLPFKAKEAIEALRATGFFAYEAPAQSDVTTS